MFDPLTHHRREFLARSIMDALKLAVAAGLASDFFVKYSMSGRIVLAVVTLGLFVLSWLLLPSEGDL